MEHRIGQRHIGTGLEYQATALVRPAVAHHQSVQQDVDRVRRQVEHPRGAAAVDGHIGDAVVVEVAVDGHGFADKQLAQSAIRLGVELNYRPDTVGREHIGVEGDGAAGCHQHQRLAQAQIPFREVAVELVNHGVDHDRGQAVRRAFHRADIDGAAQRPRQSPLVDGDRSVFDAADTVHIDVQRQLGRQVGGNAGIGRQTDGVDRDGLRGPAVVTQKAGLEGLAAHENVADIGEDVGQGEAVVHPQLDVAGDVTGHIAAEDVGAVADQRAVVADVRIAVARVASDDAVAQG